MVKRVLTGLRTTGKLHLGHYIGALKQWKEIQDKDYECFFLLADVQALTTHADKPKMLGQAILDCVLDMLSIGLDPKKENVNFVLQSQVFERYELSVLLSMIANFNEVSRNPTLKTEKKELRNITMGFMNYPVDQAADIYMMSPLPLENNNQLLVPVGEDQIPHLEYSRLLARRFNSMYGSVFTVCKPLVGKVGRLVGTDGKSKMSKSLGNVINLSDDAGTVLEKVMEMYTDPKRITADIPGDTKNNPVFIYLDAFANDIDKVNEYKERYEQGKVGDVEVKRYLANIINDFLEPIRKERNKFNKGDVRDILEDGTSKARVECKKVVDLVREKMYLSFSSIGKK